MKQHTKILIGTIIGTAAVLMLKKHLGVKGVGAAKRRVFKELSMAQKAGVDFTKKFEELTEKEIKALERVGSDTGYTETYYKSLKKAYDAISGIGRPGDFDNMLPTVLEYSRYLDIAQNQFGISREQARKKYGLYTIGQWKKLLGIGAAYDVKDADGNVCLTWVEDPKAQADKKQHALEAEARAAEARKRIKKLRKAGEQMSLFGTGYAPATEPFWYGIPSVEFVWHGEWSDPEIYYRGRYYNATVAEEELYAIWRDQIEYGDTELDFDSWMKSVGGDYLKSDVLPYM